MSRSTTLRRMAPGRAASLRLVAVLAIASLSVACSSGPAGEPATATPGEPTVVTGSATPQAPSVAPSDRRSPSNAPTDPAAVALTQPWATAELTDVRTGERFTIAALVAEGRVVFLETMAIWCTNCRAQQRDVVAALLLLDAARVTWIGIDVDPSEVADDLARYSHDLGFEWPFVVAGPDFARALAEEFGELVLSPPSTPIVVVGTAGQVTLTEFGHKSIERIVELARQHGA